jgi:protein-S-isoprenylcysteine O-methyltransferase Ste14
MSPLKAPILARQALIRRQVPEIVSRSLYGSIHSVFWRRLRAAIIPNRSGGARRYRSGGFRKLTPREATTIILVRAITYATLFVGLVLVFLPAQVLRWSGVVRPATAGAPQIIGIVVAAMGAGLAIWCVLTFAFVGKGTPAPFDPPRRLVVQGPYRLVRNPMYLGAGLALAGAALVYESLALFGFAALFFLASHLFVVGYEEPTLRRTFGEDYVAYCTRVRRWY